MTIRLELTDEQAMELKALVDARVEAQPHHTFSQFLRPGDGDWSHSGSVLRKVQHKLECRLLGR